MLRDIVRSTTLKPSSEHDKSAAPHAERAEREKSNSVARESRGLLPHDCSTERA